MLCASCWRGFDVALDTVAAVVRFFVWDGVFVALALGVHVVLLVGVAVADVALDMVAGVVRFVLWDGDFVALSCGMYFVLLVCVAVADLALEMVAEVVQFVVWDGVFVALAWACTLCLLSAWLWSTWRWTWWRRWFGLSCGTACSLRLRAAYTLFFLWV